MNISFDTPQKIYFASDFHLGAPSSAESRVREERIVTWLERIRQDAAHLFLMGDIFDFWFEYKTVVPKGFLRFLGKLTELRSQQIPVTVFTGNHDMWMFGYLAEELGVTIKRHPETYQIGDASFYLAHGDGLGPGDSFYKNLKKVFEHPFFHWLFRNVHPDVGIRIATAWSGRSRKKNSHLDAGFLGEDEWLWQYAKEIEAQKHHDYYVFGHRHLPLELSVGTKSRYINLGEWIQYNTYAVFDGTELKLCTFSQS